MNDTLGLDANQIGNYNNLVFNVQKLNVNYGLKRNSMICVVPKIHLLLYLPINQYSGFDVILCPCRNKTITKLASLHNKGHRHDLLHPQKERRVKIYTQKMNTKFQLVLTGVKTEACTRITKQYISSLVKYTTYLSF